MNAKNYFCGSAAVLAGALILLAGCKKSAETPAAAPGEEKSAKPAIVSAEKNSFAEVTSKLDPGGNFYLYLSTEKILSGLSNHLAAASNLITALPNIPGTGRETMDKIFTVVGAVVQDSGVSEISGLGMSSIAREPGFYFNKLIVHHYPGQNAGIIWSIFGKAPHPLAELDFLPQSTALASSADFDLTQLWTNLLQAAQSLAIPEVNTALEGVPGKFLQATGLDLDETLKSLGNEYGMVLTLDTNKSVTLPLGPKSITIPNPALCLIIKVNSDLIFDRVDKILNSNPAISAMVFKTDKPGLKMRTVALPIPLPIELHPTLARAGDYLLLSSSDNLVREMLAVKAGETNGYKSTESFKKLSQGVPTEGNSFSLVTTAFTGAIAQLQETAMSMQNINSEAASSFQQLLHQGANVGAFSVSANGPEGWEAVGNGGSEGARMLIVPAVAMTGLLAAIAVPNFVKARSTSQKNACINNLRLIDAAKQQWALENRKKDGDTPTMEDLMPYLGRNGKKPVCPEGGVYTIGSIGEKPTCSISGHELP